MKILTQQDWMKGQRIHINSITAMPFEAHSHDFLEIAYISKGTAINIVGNQKVQLKAGTYIIIDYYTEHQIVDKSKDIEGFNCLFVPNLIDPSLANCKSFKNILTSLKVPTFHHNDYFYFQDKDGRIYDLLLHIYHELEEKNLGYQEVVRSYIIQILLFSLRTIQNDSSTLVQNPLLEQILQYMQKNYAEKNLLELVSREFKYSTSYVSLLFQRQLGVHFNEYLRQLRISIACQLLTQSDMSIQEIGFAVGYHNPHSFRTNFIAQMHMTPIQYRQNAQKNELL